VRITITTQSRGRMGADEREQDSLRLLVCRGEYQAASGHLYGRFGREVERFVASLRPAGAAEDVCQETWAAVLKALPRFDFASSVRTWLFAIARRKAADTHRGRRRVPEEPWDSREQILARALGARRPTTPASHALRGERAAAIARSLACLSPADRELVELRWACDLMPRKIIEVLGLAEDPNTVSKRIQRATRNLRTELLKCDVFASKGRPV
jgi:RNA polymerase sigma-70 factor, ECF subfamily